MMNKPRGQVNEIMCFHNWRGPCGYWGGDRHGCIHADNHNSKGGRGLRIRHECGCGSLWTRGEE